MATINSWGSSDPVQASLGGTGSSTNTAHAVLVGEGTGAIVGVGPGTNGQVLLGATSANPTWQTPAAGTGLSLTTDATHLSYALTNPVVVATGGTGLQSTTAYAVLCGGTTSTAALQSIASVGSSGSVLTSNGAGALPSFQALSGSSISVTGDSGGTLTNVSNLTLTGGSTPFTFAGSGSTETLTWNALVPVAHGGTGIATTTAYSVICAGTTSTGAFQSLSSLGTSGYVLTSNGAGALPSFQASGGNSITVDTDSGGPLTGVTTLTLAGGSSPFTFVGSGAGTATLTWGSAVPVAHGGTGDTSLTAYSVLCGGTTSTGAVQSVASVGTSGQVLTSNGAGALPTFQSLSGSSISVTGDTGGTLTNVSNLTLAGGSTGLSFGGSGSTETLTFAGITANGGTVNLGTDNANNAINIGLGTTARAIHIGDSAAAHVITIGSETGACSITQHVGTGNYVLDGAATSTITVGASLTSGTITIGGTAETGTMTLGSSSATNTLNIANGSGATNLNLANVQTGGQVNIGSAMTTGVISIGGTGAQTGEMYISPGSGAQTVTIASGSGGAKTINIGNGVSGNTISIGNGANSTAQTVNIASGAAGANSTVNILAGVATTGTQAVNIASGASASTTTIGNTTGASALDLYVGSGNFVLDGVGASTFSIAPSVTTGSTTIGGSSSSSTLNLKAGSGGINLTGAVTSANAVTITSGALTVSSGNIVLTTDNLELPQTTSSSVGVVTNGGSAFIHNFGAQSDDNTFLGISAGNFTLTSGTAKHNTGIGNAALNGLTTGEYNTSVGDASGKLITTGSNNTCIGQQSLDALTTGSYNTTFGYGAGKNYTSSESSNIIIGYDVAGTATESNVLRIGLATGTGNGQIAAGSAVICGINGGSNSTSTGTSTVITINSSDTLGTTGTGTGGVLLQNVYGLTSATATAMVIDAAGKMGTVVSSRKYKDTINDMSDSSSSIYSLRPVTFRYKESPRVTLEESTIVQYGLIAEEVNETMPQLVIHKDHQPDGVRYADLVPMLLNEIQKLEKRVKELESK